MLPSTLRLFLTLITFSTFSAAQFGPDQRWTNPNGSFPDFTDSYRQGESVTISWNALNNSISDLWLTNFDNTASIFNISLGRNINISVAGSLHWLVDIDQSVRNKSNKFNLRFFPAGAAYGLLQFQQNISPGFFVNASSGAGATTTTSSTVSSGATSSTGTASPTSYTTTGTTTAVSATTTSTGLAGASNSNNGGGLSTAAQAGIGVGVGVGVLGLFILGCCVGRKYRIARVSKRPPSYATIPPGSNQMASTERTGWGFSRPKAPSKSKLGEVEGDTAQPQELSAVENERKAVAELPAQLV